MNLSDYIAESNIVYGLKSKSKSDVLEELVNLMADRKIIADSAATLAALKDREELGSTGVGEEVAIPHAKMIGISDISVFLGISVDGVYFDSSDGIDVKIFFVVVAPEGQMNLHLKTLARISRLIKMTDFKELALSKKSSFEIHEVLKTEESKL